MWATKHLIACFVLMTIFWYMMVTFNNSIANVAMISRRRWKSSSQYSKSPFQLSKFLVKIHVISQKLPNCITAAGHLEAIFETWFNCPPPPPPPPAIPTTTTTTTTTSPTNHHTHTTPRPHTHCYQWNIWSNALFSMDVISLCNRVFQSRYQHRGSFY